MGDRVSELPQDVVPGAQRPFPDHVHAHVYVIDAEDALLRARREMRNWKRGAGHHRHRVHERRGNWGGARKPLEGTKHDNWERAVTFVWGGRGQLRGRLGGWAPPRPDAG